MKKQGVTLKANKLEPGKKFAIKARREEPIKSAQKSEIKGASSPVKKYSIKSVKKVSSKEVTPTTKKVSPTVAEMKKQGVTLKANKLEPGKKYKVKQKNVTSAKSVGSKAKERLTLGQAIEKTFAKKAKPEVKAALLATSAGTAASLNSKADNKSKKQPINKKVQTNNKSKEAKQQQPINNVGSITPFKESKVERKQQRKAEKAKARADKEKLSQLEQDWGVGIPEIKSEKPVANYQPEKKANRAEKQPPFKSEKPLYENYAPEFKDDAYEEQATRYAEPEYSEPTYEKQAPKYEEPRYAEPEYIEEPSYSEPEYAEEPSYSEPAYAEEPSYSEPAYAEEPSYSEPAYAEEPSYSEPVYEEPLYSEPAYAEEPSYSEPVYEEPSYSEPTYEESYAQPEQQVQEMQESLANARTNDDNKVAKLIAAHKQIFYKGINAFNRGDIETAKNELEKAFKLEQMIAQTSSNEKTQEKYDSLSKNVRLFIATRIDKKLNKEEVAQAEEETEQTSVAQGKPEKISAQPVQESNKTSETIRKVNEKEVLDKMFAEYRSVWAKGMKAFNEENFDEARGLLTKASNMIKELSEKETNESLKTEFADMSSFITKFINEKLPVSEQAIQPLLDKQHEFFEKGMKAYENGEISSAKTYLMGAAKYAMEISRTSENEETKENFKKLVDRITQFIANKLVQKSSQNNESEEEDEPEYQREAI